MVGKSCHRSTASDLRFASKGICTDWRLSATLDKSHFLRALGCALLALQMRQIRPGVFEQRLQIAQFLFPDKREVILWLAIFIPREAHVIVGFATIAQQCVERTHIACAGGTPCVNVRNATRFLLEIATAVRVAWNAEIGCDFCVRSN